MRLIWEATIDRFAARTRTCVARIGVLVRTIQVATPRVHPCSRTQGCKLLRVEVIAVRMLTIGK